MKKIFILLAVCCLFGCQGSDNKVTETKVCSAEVNGVKITNTLEADGDTILYQTIENELDYKAQGLTEDEINEVAENYKNLYDVTGVTYTYEVKDQIITENIRIDYETADFKDLLEVNLISSDSENVSYVSLKETLEALENYGFECK